MERLSGLIVLASMACVSSYATAQEAWSVGDYTAWTAVNMARLNEEIEETVQDRATGGESDVATSQTWTFAPAAARTKANLARFVDKSREQSPAAAADLARTFASMDIIGEAGTAMRSVGLDPHNVADAYALWWVQAWANAKMIESPSDQETFGAVAQQASAAFADTAGLTKQSDAEKQQFAEAMIVQAVLMASAFDASSGNPALRKQLAAQARKSAKEMGLDLDTMVLTKDGFGPSKGAALAPSDTGERLAADGEAAESTPLTTYAAIAAAGGAGIAAVLLAGKAMGRRE